MDKRVKEFEERAVEAEGLVTDLVRAYLSHRNLDLGYILKYEAVCVLCRRLKLHSCGRTMPCTMPRQWSAKEGSAQGRENPNNAPISFILSH